MIEQKEELQGHIVSSGVEITATIIAQKGAKGDPGIPGEDGYTPVKGVDYFTEADIESLNIPSKVSDLTNDSGFITNTVNNLTNYYLKSETYNKSEVDTLIANVNSFNVEIVQTLPITDIDLHTIYLVPKTGSSTDVYDEYIYINNSWELIGNTAVDLSNYYTKSETDTLLNAKVNSSDLSEVAISGDYDDLLNKPTLSDVISIPDNSSSNPFVITENKPGTYVFVDNSVPAYNIKLKSTIYIKYKNSSNTLTFNCGYGYLILYDTTEKTYVSPENIGTFVSFSNGSLFCIYTQSEPSGIVFRETNSLSRRTGNDETIYNSWEFISFLPKSSLVPSNDQHLVNKKYVDDNEFSGDYDDLTNKPTIPTVNDSTITIQKNGTNVDTFTTNASSNKTIDISINELKELPIQWSTRGYASLYSLSNGVYIVEDDDNFSSKNAYLRYYSNYDTEMQRYYYNTQQIYPGDIIFVSLKDGETPQYNDSFSIIRGGETISLGITNIVDDPEDPAPGEDYIEYYTWSNMNGIKNITDVSSSPENMFDANMCVLSIDYTFSYTDVETQNLLDFDMPKGTIVLGNINDLIIGTRNEITVILSTGDIYKITECSVGALPEATVVKVLADVATSGSYNDLTDKPTIPTKTSDLTNDSGFITGMVELSYGNSTWNDFITAYNAKKIVYCRASSNSNPASGSQTRKAFMAYVNNVDNPTSVEFQYVRSISSHSATQQGDQVFVYTLTSASGGTWAVQTREMSTKIVAGTNMTSSYSNGVLTLNASGGSTTIHDSYNTSTTEAYSCNYINGVVGDIETLLSEV